MWVMSRPLPMGKLCGDVPSLNDPYQADWERWRDKTEERTTQEAPES